MKLELLQVNVTFSFNNRLLHEISRKHENETNNNTAE